MTDLLRDLLDYLPDLPNGVPDFLIDPAWLAVFLATVALIPSVVNVARRLRTRWQNRHIPRNTQVHKDRENYALLLEKYEGYLLLLENLIVIRSQVEVGPDPWPPELEQQFVQTRDAVYDSLEKRGKKEKDMGEFQLMDVLESRMVGIAEERRKRAELEARQAEIEDHPLFIKCPD